jgi:PHD/YefM family antitoxin component YafN of YafNO toxin-antitoxin module
MKTFTTVELLRRLPEVELAASRGPVAITKHRKSRYVLMSIQEFDRLTASSSDPRQVSIAPKMPQRTSANF